MSYKRQNTLSFKIAMLVMAVCMVVMFDKDELEEMKRALGFLKDKIEKGAVKIF